MTSGRFRVFGLFAVLLALMAQLGAGASVPSIDPLAATGAFCHTDGDSNPPGRAPDHLPDCAICPLCAIVHAQPVLLAATPPAVPPPSEPVALRPELPPPSTAPPTPRHPPSQPRAPPILS